MSDTIVLIVILTAPLSVWALGCAAYHAWHEAQSHRNKERRP